MVTREHEQGKSAKKTEPHLTAGAHAIAAIGTRCELVVADYLGKGGAPLLERVNDSNLKQIAAALAQWTDEQAAQVVQAYLEAVVQGRRLDPTAVSRWILSHLNDAAAVADCMSVEAPEEIDLIRVLSRAGSQKLVFLATWRLRQRQVVLKRLGGSPEAVKKVVEREAQSHPLALGHPNIIETHFLTSPKGETFLAEERLPEVLHDEWRSDGVHEAANLFHDIANAINYLHSEWRLVHGDIKPDNIGKRGSSYILLDFGICRSADDFTAESTATGSLRTRAPELILNGSYDHPEKVDIWALGATVYNAITGRFPLFDAGEKAPRISTPEDRNRFEAILAQRVRDEWERRLDFSGVPHAIRGNLMRALERDPQKRPSSRELLTSIEDELTAFIRSYSDVGRFSPVEELQQLKDFLPAASILRLMPVHERQAFKIRLERLRGIQSLDSEHKALVEGLLAKVG